MAPKMVPTRLELKFANTLPKIADIEFWITHTNYILKIAKIRTRVQVLDLLELTRGRSSPSNLRLENFQFQSIPKLSLEDLL